MALDLVRRFWELQDGGDYSLLAPLFTDDALFEDPIFWNAVFYSVFYTGVATIGKFGLGLWLALLLNNHLPFKSLLRAIILLPWIVPTVLTAIAFWWIYDPQFSIISYVLVDVLGATAVQCALATP